MLFIITIVPKGNYRVSIFNFGNLKSKINQKIYDDNSMYHYVVFFVLCSNILHVTHDCSDGSRHANVLFYSGICFCQSHS